MRYNRWVRDEALKDLDRLCQTRPESAHEIEKLAIWFIDELAEDPESKGTRSPFTIKGRTYFRWPKGPLTVIFSLLPGDDRTVVIEGFLPG